MAFAFMLTACGKPADNKGTDAPNAPAVDGTETGSSKEGGLMVLGIGSDPTSVNPLYANDRVSLTISNVLYDNLYHVKSGEVVYDGLAESMTPSDDHLTYTLKLKDNIKWHDGEAITADDVIFTYDSILDDKQNAKGQNVLKSEDGVVVLLSSKNTRQANYTKLKDSKTTMGMLQNLTA